MRSPPRRLRFTDIHDVVARTLELEVPRLSLSLDVPVEALLALDEQARRSAREIIARLN